MVSPSAKEEILVRLNEKVEEYLKNSGNCAQTSFLSLQEALDLDDGAILKGLTPFPGIALRGETCGAVIGSLMALGLVFGRDKDNLTDYSAFQASLRPSRKFCRAFEQEYGSTMCGDIIEKQFGKRYDLADPVQAMEWLSCGALEKCCAVVETAVGIAAELILAERA